MKNINLQTPRHNPVNHSLMGKLTRSLTLFLVLLLIAPAARADALNGWQPWTCNGSTGTVDETSYNLTQYNNGAVFLSDWAPVHTTAVIRYNITATSGLSTGNQTIFKARVQDSGYYSRVVLYVRAYHLETGVITTLRVMDSDHYPAAHGFRVIETVIGGPRIGIGGSDPCVNDFTHYGYYIEAHLTRTGHSGIPGLGLMQLYNRQIFI